MDRISSDHAQKINLCDNDEEFLRYVHGHTGQDAAAQRAAFQQTLRQWKHVNWWLSAALVMGCIAVAEVVLFVGIHVWRALWP